MESQMGMENIIGRMDQITQETLLADFEREEVYGPVSTGTHTKASSKTIKKMAEEFFFGRTETNMRETSWTT